MGTLHVEATELVRGEGSDLANKAYLEKFFNLATEHEWYGKYKDAHRAEFSEVFGAEIDQIFTSEGERQIWLEAQEGPSLEAAVDKLEELLNKHIGEQK